MSPTMVFNEDDSLRLIIGSPGGSRIIDYTARSILYHLTKGMPIAEAIAAGNIGCITQIAAATDLPMVHSVELLDWATGGPLPKALEGVNNPAVAAEAAQ